VQVLERHSDPAKGFRSTKRVKERYKKTTFDECCVRTVSLNRIESDRDEDAD